MQHGGDIYRNSIRLDFSINVNPMGLPGRVRRQLENVIPYAENYPDHEQTMLRAMIAQKHSIRSAQVLAGSGSSEIFMGIMHGLRPRRCIVPVPSYVGYEYVLRAIGCEADYYDRGDEFGLGERFINYLEEHGDDADMVILATPNNPTGLMISLPTIEAILDICQSKHIYCVLDLCFIELTDFSGAYDDFFIRHESEYLIRVYGFTKTYAMPGVRLGYLIASDEIRDRIAAQIPEWNVSILAQHAGIACLEEGEQYLLDSREFIRRERPWLRDGLLELGIESFDSAANFIFINTDKPVFDILFHDRILIRDCDNFRSLSHGYYRIAIRSHADNKELLRVLRDNL